MTCSALRGRVLVDSPVPRRFDPRLIASLAAVYLIWSSTYWAMRVAIGGLPPLWMASARFLTAGLVLLLIGRRRLGHWPTARDWRNVAPVGVLLFLGGNGFVAIAEETVTSGGAAVVCATMPLWVGVLGVVSGEPPTKREWVALALGFAGVIVLMGGPSLTGRALHIGVLIAAPLCWALGSVLARRLASPATRDAIMLSGLEMITGGAALFLGGLVRGESVPTDAPTEAWIALAYLWLFGSLIAFTAYSWLLRNTRAVVATSYAYVNPILAVLLGALLAGEPLGISTLVANVLIIGAIALALNRPRPASVAAHSP